MFEKAYEIASSFTHPLVICTRYFDKSVDASIGSFVILNQEGWCITAAHLFQVHFSHLNHSKQIANLEKEISLIEKNSKLNPKQKRKRIKCIQRNPKWITNYYYLLASSGVELKDVKILAENDIAIGRLEPFNPKSIAIYPTLKNPSNLQHGTSLCKLGFPFHEIKVTFNEEKKTFELPDGTFPIPRFPIEGIYTRNVLYGKSKDDKYEIKYIETSSPGLRGQSGGPIFDVNGIVWGIQSRTIHLPLGFSPKVKKNNHEVEENQFLNVGWGIHPEVLISFLNDNRVNFKLSE